jgi:hypothetical protein
MSTQLILYPQSYNGQYNAISTSATEFIVNGIFFTGLDNTTSYDSSSASVPLDVLTNEPPLSANTWYRFRSTSAGTPSLPTVTSGNLVLNSTTTTTLSGIYQKLTNLIIGQQYTFTINISTTASGVIYLSAFDGTSVLTQQGFAASSSQITHSFTATATDNTIMIGYLNSGVNNVTISGISLQPQGTTPNFTNFELEDGQVICDLYEEEDIPLSLSVDEFKNVAEKVQSYSKDFNLPATKRNNQIFDNVFEITRTDTGINFNPYVKTKCVLKQDGYILFDGYLRLINIKDKEGEISYDVNLYSEVIALADTLKDRTFSDILFTELDHDYNKTNIKRSWNDSGYGISYNYANASGYRDAFSTLRYPFVDWTGQILISDGTTGTLDYPQLVNLEQAFRPFINIKYLIDRIFADTPFTFTSDFFDTTEFKKLYMDFNWGSEENGSQPFANNYLLQGDSAASNYWINESSYTAASKLRFNLTASGNNDYWNNTSYKYISPVNNLEVDCEYYIKLESDATSATYSNNLRIAKFDVGNNHLETFAFNNDSITSPNYGPGTKIFQGTFSTVLQANEYIQAQSKTLTPDKIRMSNDTIGGYGSWLDFYSTNEPSLVSTLLTRIRGELGQWDFLKGIMTMFNLVTMPDKNNPDNIIIEPYSDVFITNTAGTNLAARSIQHDWTDKVDVSEMKLTPLTDLNKKTIFKFVEDEDDYAFNLYKQSTQHHLYGSKNYDASGFTILEGIDEIIAEPFAATIPKPLFEFANFITPVVYAIGDDGTASGFENSPRIMYNNGIKDTGITYFIPAQNGLSSENQDHFLQFSHLTDIPTIVSSPPVDTDTRDFHFGECQLFQPIGNPTVNNLYNIYWSPYYDELYNADTRIMTLKVNLSPADINTFKFNDKVMIKNRVFRVNKIEYKPNDLAKVEFILIP